VGLRHASRYSFRLSGYAAGILAARERLVAAEEEQRLPSLTPIGAAFEAGGCRHAGHRRRARGRRGHSCRRRGMDGASEPV